jgi:GH35 family endo-1,4-beta-xylanase
VSDKALDVDSLPQLQQQLPPLHIRQLSVFRLKPVLRTLCCIIFAVAFLTQTTNLLAQEAQITPPPGGTDLLTFNQDAGIKFDTAIDATATWEPVEQMPFDTSYNVAADTRFSERDNMRITVPLTGAINKGDVILLSFWVRRPGAGGQPNNIYMNVQSDSGDVQYQYKLSAYRPWQQHVRSFTATENFEPGKSNMTLLLGEAGKKVDIAQLRLINYGPDYDAKSLPFSTINYKGRDPEAQWRKDALARIEKIRKGDLSIQVVDAAGNPVTNAKVKIEMQRHAFTFGNAVNAFLVGAGESHFPFTKKRPGGDSVSTWEQAQQYRKVVVENFNCVTFENELRPHVWKSATSGAGKSKTPHEVFTQGAIPFLQKNNIAIRGHYLSWAAMDFNAMEKQFIGNPEAHRQWLWAHMADIVPATSDYITEWDTINHIIAWGKHTYEKEYGGMQIYADIMKEARRLAPNASHAINEGKILPNGYKREPYKRVIRFLNEQGQAPDTVGFMAHFGLASLTPPQELLEVYDDFATIAPRLQLSEFDVEAGDDDALQADYYRDVMIASFSHPNFVGIIQWGLWENHHWKPAAALWRKDWTLKPAGQVYVDLVKNQWWTNDSATTNNSGRCQIRGFHGDYRITVEHDGKTVVKDLQLNGDGVDLQIQIK